MGNNTPGGHVRSSVSEGDIGPVFISVNPSDVGSEVFETLSTSGPKSTLSFRAVSVVEPEVGIDILEEIGFKTEDALEAKVKDTIPVVFKWSGPGSNIFVSGSYDNWKTRTPLVKSQENFYSIIELPEGFHQYKFEVDGVWCCDTSEPKIANNIGSENNYIAVKKTDFEVFDALSADAMSMPSTTNSFMANQQGVLCGRPPSPPGNYNRDVPTLNSVGTNTYGFRTSLIPPTLPPQLQDGILNKAVSLSCEPDLLPVPSHCTLNHMYALSIKDGVMVLSTIKRYRKKYITTLLYKPI